MRGLLAKGLDMSQLKAAMVAQYGQEVLAQPPASGFNLTVYILPPAIFLGGLALLAYTLPKWRERSRRAAATRLAWGGAARQRRRQAPRRRARALHLSRRFAYIESGALTPSSPSTSASCVLAATHSAIRNDSTDSGSAPTTLQSR